MTFSRKTSTQINHVKKGASCHCFKATRGQDFPFTREEHDFLSRHAKDLPAALEKLAKEKFALIKKIGVMVRKIAREQAKQETKQDKNNANDKKAV